MFLKKNEISKAVELDKELTKIQGQQVKIIFFNIYKSLKNPYMKEKRKVRKF